MLGFLNLRELKHQHLLVHIPLQIDIEITKHDKLLNCITFWSTVSSRQNKMMDIADESRKGWDINTSAV